MREKLEHQIALESEAGREAQRLWLKMLREMPGEVKLKKACEITDHVRSLMRAGLKEQNPDLSEEELQEMYVDRLLGIHGWSLQKIRRLQAADQPQDFE